MNAQVRHKWTRYFLATLILIAFGYIFWPFFTPLILAGIFAFAFEPFVAKFGFNRKKRKWSSVLFVLTIFLTITVPVGLVVQRLIVKAKEISKVGIENTQLYKSGMVLFGKISAWLSRISDQLNIDASMLNPQEMFTNFGAKVMAGAGEIVTKTPELLLAYFVFSAALYIFLTESKFIKRVLVRSDMLSPTELNHVIHTLHKSSYSTLMVSLFIGSIQALIVSLGGNIFGYYEFLILFVVTFFLSFIPVIGAAPVALAISAMSFLQEDYKAGIGLLVVAVVAGTIDNILRPYLVSSSEEELNPLVSLIAIIGAIIVYGIPGLLLGPILTHVAFRLLPVLLRKEAIKKAD